MPHIEGAPVDYGSFAGLKGLPENFHEGSPHEAFRGFANECAMLWSLSETIIALAENPQNLRLARNFASNSGESGGCPERSDVFVDELAVLFRILLHFKTLRHEARLRIRSGGLPGCLEGDTIQAYQDLSDWTSSYPACSPQFIAGHVYRSCIAVYFQRSIRPSTPHPSIKEVVDRGLWHIRQLAKSAEDLSIEPILLTPLLLLGFSAFEAEQRVAVADAFQQLMFWADLDKVRAAREVVQHTWALMDRGSEVESWDWEALIDSQYRVLNHEQSVP
jgi:hypothetical protein